jgi:DNA-binding NarL/FixJ family response regulator
MSPEPSFSAGRVAVAVVEDDPHFRLFLESMLESSTRCRLEAASGSAAEALAWPETVAPHVILVDVGLPDRSGSDLVADLLVRFPQALVLMVTADGSAEVVLQSIRHGAHGFVLKGGREAEILGAIDDALAGGAPMSPFIARRVLEMMRLTPTPAFMLSDETVDPRLRMLTEREAEILRQVASGAGDKEVAEHLGLSRSTVKNALLQIYQKWRVRSRTEAAVVFTRLLEGRE